MRHSAELFFRPQPMCFSTSYRATLLSRRSTATGRGVIMRPGLNSLRLRGHLFAQVGNSCSIQRPCLNLGYARKLMVYRLFTTCIPGLIICPFYTGITLLDISDDAPGRIPTTWSVSASIVASRLTLLTSAQSCLRCLIKASELFQYQEVHAILVSPVIATHPIVLPKHGRRKNPLHLPPDPQTEIFVHSSTGDAQSTSFYTILCAVQLTPYLTHCISYRRPGTFGAYSRQHSNEARKTR